MLRSSGWTWTVACVLAAGTWAGCDREQKGSSALASGGGAPEVKMAECLPCGGHQVVIGPTTPTSVFEGKSYFFCADQCKVDFDADPGKWLGRPPQTRPTTGPTTRRAAE